MKYFFSIALILGSIATSAQQMGEQLLKLVITEAKFNDGTDLTKQYTSNNAYLLIHKNLNEQGLYFANIMPAKGSKSFGKISELEQKKGDSSEQLSFKWSFQNSYNTETGDVYVMIGLIYSGEPSSFLCMINFGNEKVLQFKGYVAK